jgi:hypothetical protein
VTLEIIYPNLRDWWDCWIIEWDWSKLNDLIILIYLWFEINNTGLMVEKRLKCDTRVMFDIAIQDD